ncbi:MAG: hypothetical protein KBD07_01000, partial [Candidatus Omnitrophica bacterium]|nr:hypothetical protein [Candidatus Omnitrophota bacterium]
NWSDLQVFSDASINYQDLQVLTDSSINFSDLQQLTDASINWSDLQVFSDASINYQDLQVLSDASINYQDMQVQTDAAINWADFAYMTGNGINFTNLNGLSVAGINWDDTARQTAAGVNWEGLGALDGTIGSVNTNVLATQTSVANISTQVDEINTKFGDTTDTSTSDTLFGRVGQATDTTQTKTVFGRLNNIKTFTQDAFDKIQKLRTELGVNNPEFESDDKIKISVYKTIIELKSIVEQMAAQTAEIAENKLNPEDLTRMIVNAIADQGTREGKAITGLLQDLQGNVLDKIKEIDVIKKITKDNQKMLKYLVESSAGGAQVETTWETGE